MTDDYDTLQDIEEKLDAIELVDHPDDCGDTDITFTSDDLKEAQHDVLETVKQVLTARKNDLEQQIEERMARYAINRKNGKKIQKLIGRKKELERLLGETGE